MGLSVNLALLLGPDDTIEMVNISLPGGSTADVQSAVRDLYGPATLSGMGGNCLVWLLDQTKITLCNYDSSTGRDAFIAYEYKPKLDPNDM